eukprot:TRINITY_DN49662_c0_g1_i1.p1 TRINITY_DN49662_c0_g1~~TRINITY_DN49662_c0_g1_i1.p1  ORF type:complete len:372 (+),score=31.95 TRINITY_DN49662_c0_g1_i1:225-1340(+)
MAYSSSSGLDPLQNSLAVNTPEERGSDASHSWTPSFQSLASKMATRNISECLPVNGRLILACASRSWHKHVASGICSALTMLPGTKFVVRGRASMRCVGLDAKSICLAHSQASDASVGWFLQDVQDKSSIVELDLSWVLGATWKCIRPASCFSNLAVLRLCGMTISQQVFRILGRPPLCVCLRELDLSNCKGHGLTLISADFFRIGFYPGRLDDPDVSHVTNLQFLRLNGFSPELNTRGHSGRGTFLNFLLRSLGVFPTTDGAVLEAEDSLGCWRHLKTLEIDTAHLGCPESVLPTIAIARHLGTRGRLQHLALPSSFRRHEEQFSELTLEIPNLEVLFGCAAADSGILHHTAKQPKRGRGVTGRAARRHR